MLYRFIPPRPVHRSGWSTWHPIGSDLIKIIAWGCRCHNNEGDPTPFSSLKYSFQGIGGGGCSSGGRALACWDRQIEPTWWVHLQFGLFSIPSIHPQLVHQSMWYVLFCLWESAYKRSLAAWRKEEPMWRQRVSSKEICHICLMYNSRWYENQCILEAALNKTNWKVCGKSIPCSSEVLVIWTLSSQNELRVKYAFLRPPELYTFCCCCFTS